MGDLFLRYGEMRLAEGRKQGVEETKVEDHNPPGPKTEATQELKTTTSTASSKTRGTKRKR